jgi:hypothetical protein
MFLGTNADNAADRIAKGRCASQQGAKNGNAKLTIEKVMDIKARLDENISLRSVAREFKVSPGVVAHIKTGRLWGHVTGVIRP